MEKAKNILLALMQLNIGGAETHVTELAKELKRRGYNVIVASNGGVYVRELEDYGIKHYSVPLINKHPLNMLRSKNLLKKIIIDEKIDIVHSHARIPSFILGKLHKKMKFPFITTAHWVFTTKYGLKYITEWGEKTIAVSEDIKTYLMDNYNIPESDIKVTINGIDTEKFSPETDCSDIKKEFGISDNDYVITYASRLDESRSLVAKQLIDAVPSICEKINNAKIIIVGNGDDFENVKAKAKSVNESLGRTAIVLTGARTDINKLIAPCSLFIGVSRAALEAMAAEKPVIIAGNEGYIGLFDESKLGIGIDTNFCCRGCAMSSSELLLADINNFLALGDNEKTALGQYGRRLIKSNYSVSKMTDDCETAYKWLLSKNDEILISGYYGFKNSGDDALLHAIVNDIRLHKESPNIVVLSADPHETMRTYHVKAIGRLNIFKIHKHIKSAGILISGGGTLIQDATSKKSLWYYLTVINSALRRHVPVMLYSNGIGPITHAESIRRTERILNKVDLITLRDEKSLGILKEIGVTKPKTEITADPAFALSGDYKSEGRRLLENEGVSCNGKLLGVCVRKWHGNSHGFEKAVADTCNYAYEKYGYTSVFIPMQHEKDTAISENISHMLNHKGIVLGKKYSVKEMMGIVANLHICIGMRLHSLIYCAVGGIPIIGLVYDPKISGFMERINQNLCLDVGSLTADGLRGAVDKCTAEYDSIADSVKNCCKQLADLAHENGRLAMMLYENGSVDI